ncbi:MAG TPA: hypothetical protein VFK30_00675 [Anaerolineae bacterium]|nr:hypothetical protein [Anaerolineae bacterium]
MTKRARNKKRKAKPSKAPSDSPELTKTVTPVNAWSGITLSGTIPNEEVFHYIGFGIYGRRKLAGDCISLRVLKPGIDDVEVLLDKRAFKQLKKFAKQMWKKTK